MKLEFEMQGIAEIQKVLEDLAPRHARNIMKNTVYGVAAELRNEVRAAAPVDDGKLKRSVSAKNLRSPPDKPASIVYFKPQGFHWRFVEHGTVKMPAIPFVTPAVNRFQTRLPQLINERFIKSLDKAVARELKKRER